jgi:Choice-of-anchor I domain
VSPDSSTAWVTLQENNALAIIDINAGVATSLVGLGFKDHLLAGNGLDASDRDDAINIANWPVQGMYLPDGITAIVDGGQTYLLMVNEGDVREWDGFVELARAGGLDLDPAAFPNADELQESGAIGRLRVTTASGDTDDDGDFDALYSFGARSFSVRNAAGGLLFDSGDQLEQITATFEPKHFNAGHDDGTFDSRSDDKGPEPEGVTVGEAFGRRFAFIALERIGGIATYDVTDPTNPCFVEYTNNRHFNFDPEDPRSGDLGPEGLVFINAANSPNGRPLLVAGNEVSGTVTIFELRLRD